MSINNTTDDAVLAWKPPPGRANAVFNDRVLAELEARPGEWGLIRLYRGHTTARNVKVPAGYEVRARCRYVNGVRHTELYGRRRPGVDNPQCEESSMEAAYFRGLLVEARDLLHHVPHNGQECPGCDLENRIDTARAGGVE